MRNVLFSFVISRRFLPIDTLPGKRPRPAPGERWRRLAARSRTAFDIPRMRSVPFILVMDNYLLPVYVTSVLCAPASVFGGGEIAAVGALLAGAFIP